MTLESDFFGTHPLLTVTVAGDRAPEWPAANRKDVRTLALDMRHKHHRGFWAMQLDEAARAAGEPHVVVARGLACLAVVRWAQLSPKSYLGNIAGACLFSPLSFMPAQAPLAQALQPSPTLPLPFPSLVVEHRTAPLVAHLLTLIDSWGSHFIDIADFAAPDLSPPVRVEPHLPGSRLWR
ncbi:alpha/beta hydrolase [Sphingomonas sp. H39-1-10]|uniref:alpha/beta hydrolase n=1 Tax=Sphingomonas TaxID=13687 RepID=UPI000892608E|nr:MULTISPECIES: alpha/beta hydrolase [Sphingomonas]MDF0488458.1 alpha/beta hydrolase [Sphingomonas pollutisoli]SDA11072.1 Serine hydrolase [Sphingomonas sp. NFR15]